MNALKHTTVVQTLYCKYMYCGVVWLILSYRLHNTNKVFF